MITRRTTDEVASSSNAMMGLSGLDTATMLKAMMKPYKTAISSLSQKQQVVAWKQERYRDIISKLNEFKSKYFDYRNPATNITSEGTWKKFSVENHGDEYVKITATTSSKPGGGKIEYEKEPAATTLAGRSGLMKEVKGSTAPSWSTAVGSYLTINMDGIVRNIAITADMASQPTEAEKVAKLQSAIDAAFGANMITAGLDVNVLTLTANTLKVNQFSIIDGSVSTARMELGFGGSSNLSNKAVMTDTLGAFSSRMVTPLQFKSVSTYNGSGTLVTRNVVEFTINGSSFQFSEFDSVKTVMDTINNSGCGVKMSYDNKSDQFKLTASTCGPGDTINITETDTDFFGVLGLRVMNPSGNWSMPFTIIGGDIDPNLVSNVNAYYSNPSNVEFEFAVTVNGVTENILLTKRSYIDPDDMLNEINALLSTAFSGSNISVSAVPGNTSSDPWRLAVNFAQPASEPVQSFNFDFTTASADVSVLGGLPDPFGLDGLKNALSPYSQDIVNGEFGRVIIDGVTLQVDRPVFEYNGILYDLKKLPPAGSDPIRYTITTDTDKIVELVRGFVDAYNEVVKAIGTALGEKRDRDYTPLTDEQRAGMSESEINKWELKAKTGILRGDTAFISLSTKLRLMVFNPVYEKYGDTSSVPMSLKKMGIDTKDGFSSFNPADNGALFIDEEMLRYAVETNLDQIAYLFTKEPQKYVPDALDADKPASWQNRMQRMYDDATGGIATKFIGVLNDYVGMMRGSNGVKGILIEKAGVENDTSDLYNLFTKEILEYEKRINSLWNRYDKIEKQKIRTLSLLETIISKSATQSDWIQSQMTSSGS